MTTFPIFKKSLQLHPNKPIQDSCKLYLKIQKLFGKSVCLVEAREKDVLLFQIINKGKC